MAYVNLENSTSPKDAIEKLEAGKSNYGIIFSENAKPMFYSSLFCATLNGNNVKFLARYGPPAFGSNIPTFGIEESRSGMVEMEIPTNMVCGILQYDIKGSPLFAKLKEKYPGYVEAWQKQNSGIESVFKL